MTLNKTLNTGVMALNLSKVSSRNLNKKPMTALEFDSSISELRPTLRTFTYRFTSNREESQDLVQDTILKALKYRKKFRKDTNLKGWFYDYAKHFH